SRRRRRAAASGPSWRSCCRSSRIGSGSARGPGRLALLITSLCIVDDFLADPEVVRDAALRLEYVTTAAPTNFPGRNSRQRLRIGGLEEAISHVVGERLVGAEGTVHGHTRLTLAEDDALGRYRVHVDPFHVWSGILYLTPDAFCRGGTEFFRHKR